ncbi:hypothetical protein ACQP25_44565 (plasmid) [Microtetraspora malaysiensis]|uniref:hypothetical protein n=1 Tax=Microtetraspora malaysiensis TaxID=161358 RepID=UPI003D8FCD7A
MTLTPRGDQALRDVALPTARDIVARLPMGGRRLLDEARDQLGPDATDDDVTIRAAQIAIKTKAPMFERPPVYDSPDSPRPADCDAYLDLSTVTAPTNVTIREEWCARQFDTKELVVAGDEHGRRAVVKVLGWVLDRENPDLLYGPGVRVLYQFAPGDEKTLARAVTLIRERLQHLDQGAAAVKKLTEHLGHLEEELRLARVASQPAASAFGGDPAEGDQ